MEEYFHLIDYYIKDLDPDEQRGITGDLRDKFTSYHKEVIDDIKDDYKNVFERTVFSDKKQIERYLQRVVHSFIEINERMMKNGRYPLFQDPYNLPESMAWRDELLSFMAERTCNKIVGCKSFDDYEPLVYKNDSN